MYTNLGARRSLQPRVGYKNHLPDFGIQECHVAKFHVSLIVKRMYFTRMYTYVRVVATEYKDRQNDHDTTDHRNNSCSVQIRQKDTLQFRVSTYLYINVKVSSKAMCINIVDLILIVHKGALLNVIIGTLDHPQTNRQRYLHQSSS